ncbi:MAG: Do family serine endopeptidase [Gammaproteobacteria bacterium]
MKRTLLLCLILVFPVLGLAGLPAEVNGKPLPSLAPMIQKALPGVVNISGFGVTNPDPGPSMNQDPSKAPHPKKFIVYGSGVIIDASSGYVVTNAHVIKDAKQIKVTLKDGQTYDAKTVGVDPLSDIAVLQIPSKNLTALPLANSDKLQVGDFVVAIGSPFGLSQTVTSGIISALQRNDLGIERYENFIQTDTPINPGNSGGALLNLRGELIGINTAILAAGGGNIGIGFAIPSNMTKTITSQLIKYGSVRRGLLGVMVQTLNPPLAEAFHIHSTSGAVVTQVNPNSPAAKAHIQAGDIITSVDNQAIHEASQISNIVGLQRVGTTVKVNYLRNGKSNSTSVVLASPKEYLEANAVANQLLFGLNMRDYSQVTALHGTVLGVQITGIAEESPAFRATPTGLRPGDVIISPNLKPVHNISELVAASKQDKQMLLNVLRGEGAMFILVS